MPTSTTADAALLQLRDVSSGYGATPVLKHISLVAPRGSIVVVIGANGAGKSTLLGTISGLVTCTGGEVTMNGTPLTTVPSHKRVQFGLAHVPEGRRIFPRLTVAENLRMGAYSVPHADDRLAREEEVFELFPILRERRQQMGGLLSGGEQQMLAIGRALMSAPSLLLLDEPSMGVAPILVQKIFATIVALQAKGVTILLVEQNARRALEIASYAYVLEQGAVALEGPGRALLGDARVQQSYLGQ